MLEFRIDSILLEDDTIDPRWIDSPFLRLKQLPPKQKGVRFELIVKEILSSLGHDIKISNTTDYDFVIDGQCCELKGSTTTKNTIDSYSFLQIRPKQEYDILIFATFCFDGTITLYRLSKSDIQQLISSGIIKPQHGGSKGHSGTFIYTGSMKPFKDYMWYQGKYGR